MKTKNRSRRLPSAAPASVPSAVTKRAAPRNGTRNDGATRTQRPRRKKPFVL